MATRGEVRGTCNDTIVSWCLAHGYSADQAAVLETEGVESFALITELDDDDKRGFASALGFSDIETAAFLKAMHSDTTSTYADAISVGLSIDEYRKKLATISTGETDSDICKDDVLSWCLANGYTDTDAGKLAAAGVDSFTFMTELTEDDKAGLAADELGLKKFKAKKFLIALNEISARVYAQAIRDGCTFDEYKQELKDARLGKASGKGSAKATKATKAKAKAKSKHKRASVSEPGAAGDEKSSGEETDGSSDDSHRVAFPPGLNIVPHRVMVLDRKKAMRDNPAFKPKMFCDLADLSDIEDKDLKIILVVGATGAGKSTMINSLMNYLYQVRFADPWRLKLIQEPPTKDRKDKARSQTDQVLGYLIEKPPAMDGKSLLIIDTPGFGDTRGPKRDSATVAELRKYFKEKVIYLNAICFVVKATETRLGALQKRLFDQVLGLFGKDIASIITMLFTFSDAKEPPAVSVLEAFKISYGKSIKLNNSAFFLDKDSTDLSSRFDELYWDLGVSSFQELLDHVLQSFDVSLDSTKKVLDRREELNCYIENIRKFVDEGLSKLDELEQTVREVHKFKSQVDAHKGFEIKVKTWKQEKRPKEKFKYNTVCDLCLWTCHEDCGIADDSRKMGCWAIDRDSGCCKFCPGKCRWEDHQNKDYFYKKVQVIETKTDKDLYARYTQATSEKSRFEQLTDNLHDAFKSTQKRVFLAIRATKDAVEELQRIALRPNTMHDDAYFDMMIEQERTEKQLDWEKRVDMLKELKAKSEYLSEVMDAKWDPFQRRLDRMESDVKVRELEVAESSGGVLARLKFW